jgi:cytochrome P450
MDSYLQRFDQTPEAERWPLVRGWIAEEPLPFYKELREQRPVLVMPELVLAARFADCDEILRRYDLFSAALLKPKEGSYFMAQDDTAVHWREKSIMKAILDFEELPSIREYVGTKTAAILASANGKIDAVDGLSRAVPVALVQDKLGFTHSDPQKLRSWSYWNQMDAFWNQAFSGAADPQGIVRQRELANLELGAYMVALIGRRVLELEAREHWDESIVGRVTGLLSKGVKDARELIQRAEGKALPSTNGRDPVSRLLMLSFSNALIFDMERVLINAGGLLIGTVETTSHAVVNALSFLLQNPDLLAKARAAAVSGDLTTLDGCVFEALRFRPAFTYFIRLCAKDTVLARATEFETPVAAGRTVLALTASAMFDETAFSHPDQFDPKRDLHSMFHFGMGLHECLGRAIGAVMIPEIVRQVLLLQDLQVDPVDFQGGPVPQSWQWHWKPS